MRFLPDIAIYPFHPRKFKNRILRDLETKAIDEYFWKYYADLLDAKINENNTEFIEAVMSFSCIELELRVELCVAPKNKDKVSQDDIKELVMKNLDTLDKLITFEDEDYRDDERFKEIFNRLKSESNIKEDE